jgi:hypothetical protein
LALLAINNRGQQTPPEKGERMLNADTAPRFETCPRCGDGGLEVLETHSYCVGCNYSGDSGSHELVAIPDWAVKALKQTNKMLSRPKLIPLLGVTELPSVESKSSREKDTYKIDGEAS